MPQNMKKFILSIVFISCFVSISAQENDKTINTFKKDNSTVEVATIKLKTLDISANDIFTDNKKVCYGETSKTAFYEVLISQNGFNINLKNSSDLVIKNTEEIISKKRDEVLYSEKED
ncbi:hypothetical protein GCM10009430_14240 [Aquimarina litoralis]|uniref:Auto-transporter adhesin head GIN domain-containing protein n=2 Tax=Aquimarina litoralis TaxID=584605 RepID=A0ABN1IMD1_9FLAO